MKNIYINSRLHPLLIKYKPRPAASTWIWSCGEPHLILTPGRLARLAARLGLEDARIVQLLSDVRRHSPIPEKFCRRLGVNESRYWSPGEYPNVFCPVCYGVHNPHPEDSRLPCGKCVEELEVKMKDTPPGGVLADRYMNRLARLIILHKDPFAFSNAVLGANRNYNHHRMVDRDWDAAARRINFGETYRRVSKDLECSMGLVHKRVKEKERMWELN